MARRSKKTERPKRRTKKQRKAAPAQKARPISRKTKGRTSKPPSKKPGWQARYAKSEAKAKKQRRQNLLRRKGIKVQKEGKRTKVIKTFEGVLEDINFQMRDFLIELQPEGATYLETATRMGPVFTPATTYTETLIYAEGSLLYASAKGTQLDDVTTIKLTIIT